ncbi:hypothetical protein MMC25_005449 [Agyrium rufum]|nr:hypothetical protein [Agyrium rufum]
MAPSDYDTTGIETYHIPSFTFLNSTKLPIRVAYRSFGDPSSALKAYVPTCYQGRINETSNYTGEGGALKDYHVIVVGMLGNAESSAPSTDEGFPKELSYQDTVHAHYQLLTEHLGFEQLDVVAGFSMGGQLAYYWPAMYPDFVKASIALCGSARTSYHNWAFFEGPKTALLNSIDYADGQYKANGVWPERGLRAFGRAYCPWAFSQTWYREKKWETDLGFKTVDAHTNEWENSTVTWDPEDLLIMGHVWQKGDIGSTRSDGNFEKALEGIKARMLIMPSRTDMYFPPEDSENEVKYLKHGELAVIETIWGHVGGGGGSPKDDIWINERISGFLKEGQSTE